MTLDLTDDEKLVLVRLLTRVIEDDRYPPSPRIRTLGHTRDAAAGTNSCAPATAEDL